METTTTRQDSRAQADAVNVNTVFQTKIDSNAESTVDIDRRYLLLLLTPYAESYGLLLLMGNKIDAYHALGAAAAHHHNNTRLDIFPKVHHGSITIFGGRPPHLLETNK